MTVDLSKGLMFACHLDGNGGATDLSAKQAFAHSAADGIIWMHLDYEEPGTRDWLKHHAHLPTIATDALLDDDTRPRVLPFDNGLLINLRGVNFNDGALAEDMVSVRIWLEPHRIITTRRRKVRSPRDLYEQALKGNAPRNPADFLVRLCERLNDHLEPVVEGIEDDIEAAEQRYTSLTRAVYAGEFGHMRRKTARLRRYLAPQRDTLERLSRSESPMFDEQATNRVREQADQVTRHLEDLDLSRERATVAQEELMNRMAQTQNERMYVLSLVAAIFLPLSFLTGLFGMNIAGMPGMEDASAFYTTVVSMVIIGIAIVLYFRWKNWL